eukprot:4815429-Heterocapsa_arctica.AAC.1
MAGDSIPRTPSLRRESQTTPQSTSSFRTCSEAESRLKLPLKNGALKRDRKTLTTRKRTTTLKETTRVSSLTKERVPPGTIGTKKRTGEVGAPHEENTGMVETGVPGKKMGSPRSWENLWSTPR